MCVVFPYWILINAVEVKDEYCLILFEFYSDIDGKLLLYYKLYTGLGKSRFTVVYMENNTIINNINNNTKLNCISCTHNCKRTFAPFV